MLMPTSLVPTSLVKTHCRLILATLCGSLLVLLVLLMAGCATFKPKSEAVAEAVARPASYRIVAQRGPGAAKMFYYAHLFPAIRMSKSGAPLEKMTPLQGPGGEIKAWKAASSRSASMGRLVEKAFRGAGYELISFPELLARTQPYSVLVVSSFYTDPTPIKEPVEGGPDHTVTVKLKGVLFGLDLDPARSMPVGTVLGTGFYSKQRDELNSVIGKLIIEATRNLGDQQESYGNL